MPTVSVVMPVRNGALFVDAALASIVGQSRQPDEVVIVDDASTDDTAARVRRWADVLPLVLLQHDRTMGCGSSRSHAITACAGDLVAPLDADDVWLPEHLETLVPLAADPMTIAATRPVFWHPGQAVDVAGRARRTGRGRGRDPLPPVPPARSAAGGDPARQLPLLGQRRVALGDRGARALRGAPRFGGLGALDPSDRARWLPRRRAAGKNGALPASPRRRLGSRGLPAGRHRVGRCATGRASLRRPS